MAARGARTEWLLFTDADVAFAADYFDLLPGFLTTDALYWCKTIPRRIPDYYQWFLRGQTTFDRLGIPAASGSNLLIRREVFHAIGGFDLSLTCNEDSEIAWRIRRNGYSIRFIPELIVYAHDHRRLEQGQFRKTWHSLFRSALLFSGLLPERWRHNDWGYWSSRVE
ncbi:MAG: glycosyltransferase [Chloroflexota bacterium]